MNQNNGKKQQPGVSIPVVVQTEHTATIPIITQRIDESPNNSNIQTDLQIPRPDTVPQRKASILHPSVHSKLSPQPHIHHDKNDDCSTN